MNKKYTTYLLLLLVASIWGYIFYKFFSDLAPSKAMPTDMSFVPDTLLSPEDTTEEKFTILASYRDPFTGNIAAPASRGVANRSMSKPKAPQVKQVITWPPIAYMGLINNTHVRKKIGLLQINTDDHMVATGDLIADIKIVTITNNEIILTYQKETKSFGKSGK